jgi:DNA-binding MarR family transcriptional regulator
MDQVDFFEVYGYRVLKSLRRIIRAVDIHSRKLNSEFSVTTPQMICLYVIAKAGEITQRKLALEVDLGASTVTGVLDRLEAKGFITRTRQAPDRRKVMLHATESGRELTQSAPALLQEQLSKSLQQQSELEQVTIALSLEKIVEMMNAEHLDSSPNLIPNAQINEPPVKKPEDNEPQFLEAKELN